MAPPASLAGSALVAERPAPPCRIKAPSNETQRRPEHSQRPGQISEVDQRTGGGQDYFTGDRRDQRLSRISARLDLTELIDGVQHEADQA